MLFFKQIKNILFMICCSCNNLLSVTDELDDLDRRVGQLKDNSNIMTNDIVVVNNSIQILDDGKEKFSEKLINKEKIVIALVNNINETTKIFNESTKKLESSNYEFKQAIYKNNQVVLLNQESIQRYKEIEFLYKKMLKLMLNVSTSIICTGDFSMDNLKDLAKDEFIDFSNEGIEQEIDLMQELFGAIKEMVFC